MSIEDILPAIVNFANEIASWKTDAGNTVESLLQAALNNWSGWINQANGLLLTSPDEFSSAAWGLVERINPYFVSVACTLIILFFLWGFFNDTVDMHREFRAETLFKYGLRFFAAQYLVVNNLTIIKAMFGMVSALVRVVVNVAGTGNIQYSYEATDQMTEAMKNMSLLTSPFYMFVAWIFALICTVAGIYIFYLVFVRFLKILVIIPFGALAFSTFAGGGSISKSTSAFFRYALSVMLEAVVMVIAISICSVIISNNVLGSLFPSIDTLSNLAYVTFFCVEKCFMVLATVGIVKGAQVAVSRALAL